MSAVPEQGAGPGWGHVIQVNPDLAPSPRLSRRPGQDAKCIPSYWHRLWAGQALASLGRGCGQSPSSGPWCFPGREELCPEQEWLPSLQGSPLNILYPAKPARRQVTEHGGVWNRFPFPRGLTGCLQRAEVHRDAGSQHNIWPPAADPGGSGSRPKARGQSCSAPCLVGGLLTHLLEQGWA